MARKNFIPSSTYPYHVCNRVHNKEAFPIPLNDVWKIMADELALTHHLYGLEVHTFVLMGNHYHMIAGTPHANLDRCMLYFQRNISRRINLASNKINQTFGHRYARTLIRQPHHYDIAYKYVYRNPVEAGFCSRVEEYNYSSLQMYLGLRTLDFPLVPDDRLLNETTRTLAWLNTQPIRANYLHVKKAMSNLEFDFGTSRATRRKIDLLDY